jgi:hypothetical protein
MRWPGPCAERSESPTLLRKSPEIIWNGYYLKFPRKRIGAEAVGSRCGDAAVARRAVAGVVNKVNYRRNKYRAHLLNMLDIDSPYPLAFSANRLSSALPGVCSRRT